MNIQERINNRYPREKLKVIQGGKVTKPIIIECLTCGKIKTYAKADGVLNHKGKKYVCEKCGKGLFYKEKFCNKLKELYPNDNLEVYEYTNGSSNTTIKCLRCGKINKYDKAKNALRHIRPYFCSNCYPQKQQFSVATKKKFLEFINNSKNWELVEPIENKIIQSKDKVKCKCLRCGNVSFKNMNEYLKRGCTYCSGTMLKTHEQFVSEVNNEFEALDKYVNAYTKINLLHKSCGNIYKTSPHNFFKNNQTCPFCSSKRSKGEKKIKDFLNRNNMLYEEQFLLAIGNKKVIIDFYLPQYNFYIEYNGEQHYHPVKFFGGLESFEKQQERDRYVRETLKEKLIEIDYKNFNNIDTILYDKILQSSETNKSQVNNGD